MIIMKKLEVSEKENIKESIIKICTKNEKKAIIFDKNTCKKIKAIRPERKKNVFPIKALTIVEYTSKEGLKVYAYDSVDESLAVAWTSINDNLYLLDQIRYKNEDEETDINYKINSVIKYISIALLKFKKKI